MCLSLRKKLDDEVLAHEADTARLNLEIGARTTSSVVESLRMARANALGKLVSNGARILRQANHDESYDPSSSIAEFRKEVISLISTFEHPDIYFARLNDAESKIEPTDSWHNGASSLSGSDRVAQIKMQRAAVDALLQLIDELKKP